MANYDGTSTVAGVAPSGNKYQLVVPSKNGSYDGDMLVKNYSSLNIDCVLFKIKRPLYGNAD